MKKITNGRYKYKGYRIAYEEMQMGEDCIRQWSVYNPNVPNDFPFSGHATVREAKEWINYRINLFKD